MTVLVTGGAGYIGAHVVRLLVERGTRVVVVDDVSTGARDRVSGAPLEALDLTDVRAADRLVDIAERHDVDAIIHLAAKKQVGESMLRPTWYYRQNVGGLANVLDAVERAGIERFVFSSSAAVYGAPDRAVVDETVDTAPINPYGETKLIGEWMLRDVTRVCGLRAVSLRYFNVAGAGWPELGDPKALNLVTIVLDRMERGERPIVFGRDFDTPDGTGIRDYVHVLDLAEAHLAALDHLRHDGPGFDVFNVGTGASASVLEVIGQIELASGRRLQAEFVERREGDPAALIADPTRINAELGWRGRRNLPEVVASAWQAHRYRIDRDRAAGARA
ncbi:UDP-glucose 4-epimerase GalE [Agromyces sp. H66]|uniref:UDP-glucose 4-epimerase GalE n=1 Tax=Agromyces sp. H66 TaxID=2529859 RepID=UPI0010AAD6D7|nr:UDP-glucose 4-epimerase GalE [Agromyces sp. H66]